MKCDRKSDGVLKALSFSCTRKLSMLKQGSVHQLRQKLITRENSLLVIAMCYYPRGIKKEWADEFRNILAPDRTLFKEWKDIEQLAGHEQAFSQTRYEERFHLSPIALYMLKLYTKESKPAGKNVYLICQCEIGERCHREMLLLTAAKKYGAEIESLFHSYPIYEERIIKMDDTLKLW